MDPVAVGGVGGSGTRAVAALLLEMRFYLGSNLNHAHDNLDYPGLDRSRFAEPRPAPIITDQEMREFRARMEAGACVSNDHVGWGWKNPPTFMSLERFSDEFPALRYVHVIRHGLDMAFSRNEGQVRRWGHLFGIDYGDPSAARSSFAYWTVANRFAIERARLLLGDRFLLLRFEDLVDRPSDSIAGLASFVGVDPTAEKVASWSQVVKTPDSIGRYRGLIDGEDFSLQELAGLTEFGYTVE